MEFLIFQVYPTTTRIEPDIKLMKYLFSLAVSCFASKPGRETLLKMRLLQNKKARKQKLSDFLFLSCPGLEQ